MIYFIDTNVFLRALINDNDKSFQDCLRVLKFIKETKIKACVSNFILAEIHWTLSSFYKFPKQKNIEALKSILNLKGLKIENDVDLNITLETYQKHNVKFIDALIASHPLILMKKAAIISYDRDFNKLDVLWKEPDEIM